MRDFQGRKRWHKVLRSDIFLFAVLIVNIILIKSVWSVYNKDAAARLNREEAETTLANLQKKKAGLEKEIARLNTDRGVEEELRRRFQVVKPGEQVLVIVDKEESKAPVSSAKPEGATEHIWNKLVGLLYFWQK
ncbi:MAG TPA: septum formation initiator family protein [Candidatus Paceibacterota bacterium]|nr:septum formation initiator family protein [Candidatus Paceibacterota bacterium]